jgi:hypothetical protein
VSTRPNYLAFDSPPEIPAVSRWRSTVEPLEKTAEVILVAEAKFGGDFLHFQIRVDHQLQGLLVEPTVQIIKLCGKNARNCRICPRSLETLTFSNPTMVLILPPSTALRGYCREVHPVHSGGLEVKPGHPRQLA